MSIDSRVHYQHMDGSPSLDAAIDKNIKKLQRFYGHIISCDVSVEAPNHHQHKGFAYKVVIKLAVPGETLIVSHAHGDNPAHEDCYVAIHDAFDSARRRLQDYARIQRHEVKHHENTVLRDSAVSEPDVADQDVDKPDGQ